MPPPDCSETVRRLAAETGTLIRTNSTAFTDLVARALQVFDPNWGRKVRREGDWGSRNADALAYRLDSPARKHYVDIIVNAFNPGETPDPTKVTAPAWQVYEGPNEGNGFWMQEPGYEPPADPPGDEELKGRVAALESTLADLSHRVDADVQGEIEVLKMDVLDLRDTIKVLRTVIESLGVRVGVLESPATQEVTGRTGYTGWGPMSHSHSVTLVLKG